MLRYNKRQNLSCKNSFTVEDLQTDIELLCGLKSTIRYCEVFFVSEVIAI